ncbi:toxin-antitoxin system HicB family antitoxin [Demequina flava]|uniref:toxin-antitoxin system HicB family antitoxin n=1 Tax=Demequina flava TaxID=1095025 RepID=UPI000785669E|nr:toxin-antitoxin system HicB family antitoxin [Demequina flava]
MELSHYTEELQRQLAVAAAAGSDEARELAERLASALEPATRLVLVEALSEAAGEISREIAPGSVDVRMRGRDVDFVVAGVDSMGPESSESVATPATPVAEDAPALAADGEDATARISLRLPDQLKQRAETAAAQEGLSLNAWLVRAVAGAVTPAPQSRRGMAAARYTGWVR